MLECIFRKVDFLPYRACAGSPVDAYYGCSGANIYRETITTGAASLLNFYYHENSDQFVLTAFLDVNEWPGWNYNVYLIDATTGTLNTVFRGFGGIGAALQLANQGEIANGPLGKLYAWKGITPYGVMEISRWNFGIYTDWEIANPILTTADVSNMDIGHFGPILSFKNKLLVHSPLGSGSARVIQTWNYDTNTKLHDLVIPEAWTWGNAWEDDERVWFLVGDNIFNPGDSPLQSLIKYNYLHNEVELVSELQPSVLYDNSARIAFDTRRKKIGAIRFGPDMADGKHQNVFEVYNPQPLMDRLTVPVNIDLASPGKRGHVVTTLLGTRGEAGASRLLTCSVASAGEATLARNEVFTGLNGSATIEYVGGGPAATPTITATHEETRTP